MACSRSATMQLVHPKSFSWAMTASLLMLPLPSDEFIDLDANYEQMIAFDR